VWPRPETEPALQGEVLDDAPPGGAPGPGEREGPGVRAVAWGISQAEAGRLGLWIGGGLVAFGAYLVLADIVPGVALLGSILMAVAGVALLGWHLAGRAGSWALHGGAVLAGSWALHGGAVLAGFGIARLIADIGDLPSAGWGTLGAGLGLVAVAIRRRWRHEGLGWQAWVGGGLVVFGGWGVLGAVFPGFPTLGDLIVPAVLVLVGAAVLRRGMRGESPRR
jgi:hypothetical protein